MSSGFGAARCWMRGCLVDVLTHQSRFMRLLCTTVHKHTHTKPDAARTIWCKILTLSVQLVHFLTVGYNIPLDVTPQEEASKPHLHVCCAWSIWSFHTFYKIIQLMLHSEVRRCQKRGAGFQQHDCNVQEKGRSLSQFMRSQMFTGRMVRIPHRSCKTFASLNHPSTHW